MAEMPKRSLRRARTFPAAGLGIALLTLALPDAVASAGRTDFDLRYTSQRPGTMTGLAIKLRYKAADDPDAKPSPLTKLVLDLPEGSVLGAGPQPPCMATDNELRASGRSACPPETKVGAGTLTVNTGVPGAGETTTDVTIFKSPTGFLELIQAAGSDTTLAVDRATVEGARITEMPPSTPGGPPDGRTAVRQIDFVFDTGFITTPSTCGGAWTFRGAFTFNDGVTDLAQAVQPCEVPAVAPSNRPRLRMAVTPTRTVARRATRFRVRLRSSSEACVRRARLALGARRVKVTPDGRATKIHAFPGPGSFHFRATARGCRPAMRTITVRRR